MVASMFIATIDCPRPHFKPLLACLPTLENMANMANMENGY
jgi:hypothetical protein